MFYKNGTTYSLNVLYDVEMLSWAILVAKNTFSFGKRHKGYATGSGMRTRVDLNISFEHSVSLVVLFLVTGES